jgi:dUTP pyrophosphatase
LEDRVIVQILRLPHAEGLPLPAYESDGAAGADLAAAVSAGEPVVISPGGRALVPTGLQIALSAGYEAQVRPRSGLAFKHGITVLNAPGTVDADYRGEVKVLLVNLGEGDFEITRGMRIAQLIIAPVTQAAFAITDDLDTTTRGAGGFGSTGTGSGPSNS